MYEIAALESAFQAGPQGQHAVRACTDREVGPAHEARLGSLLRADGGRYERCLDGAHSYSSDSEASLAVVDAMVARHFTDGEIWQTLESSRLFARRVQRKGEAHARRLYAREIAKARQMVRPFDTDPGGTAAGASRGSLKASEPVLQSTTGSEPRGCRLSWPTGDDFISRYIRYAAQRTDAPLEAHELTAVTVLSALAGPKPRLPIATSRKGWRLCIWGMYVVNSTVGRKTTTINLGRDVIAEVLGDGAIIEWEGSPQGFIQRLQERDGLGCVLLRDEYSGLMAQMN